jgi:SAM-dependent methyltransferase
MTSAASLRDRLIGVAKRYLSPEVRAAVVGLQRRFRLQWPPVGTVRFGSFRRLSPISPIFAIDRGLPIERYYIERFLEAHASDIRGRALEFGDTFYLDKFGGTRVTRKDVFSYVESPTATVVGDLAGDGLLPEGVFDCIVCTQTVQMIFDIRLAVRRLSAMLSPGGVLLLTTHGISKIGRHLDRDGWGEYWHLSAQAATSLFAADFDGEVEITPYGNVLTAISALHGLASSELRVEELDYRDRDFDVIVGVRAVRSGVAPQRSPDAI